MKRFLLLLLTFAGALACNAQMTGVEKARGIAESFFYVNNVGNAGCARATLA